MAKSYEDAAIAAGTKLLTEFCVRLDDGEFDSLSALFSEQGEFTRWGETIVGRAAILDSMHNRARSRRTEHILGNVLVERADVKQATVRAVMTVYRHDPCHVIEGPAPLVGPATIARCRAEIRSDGERWEIAHLNVDPPRFAADA